MIVGPTWQTVMDGIGIALSSWDELLQVGGMTVLLVVIVAAVVGLVWRVMRSI